VFGHIFGGGVFFLVEAALGVEKQGRTTGLKSGIQHACSIAGSGWHEYIDTGSVSCQCFKSLSVKGTEAGTVTTAGDHDDHRNLPVAVGAPVH